MVKDAHSCRLTSSTRSGGHYKRPHKIDQSMKTKLGMRDRLRCKKCFFPHTVQQARSLLNVLAWLLAYLPQSSGLSILCGTSPFPTGALAKSKRSFSGWHIKRLAAFAVSITEPPPTARNPSKLFSREKAMAFSKLQSRE